MKIQVQCFNCGKSLFKQESDIRRTAHSFCSRKCSNIYHRKHRHPNPPKIHTCKMCKGEYTNTSGHRSEAYCQACRASVPKEFLRSATLEYIHSALCLKGRHPSWANAQVRELNRRWNKELMDLSCANCGYSKHVELCHKKAITDFPESATLEEVNHQSNVVQLCRNCHWELDHGLLILGGEPGLQPGLPG